jgi:type II secretory pathway pseudopilin PulG
VRITEKRGANRGFTIMEVGLAATVLALTLVGMIEVIESGSATLDLSRKQTIAAQILHSEIDQVRLQSWATVSTSLPTALTTLTATPSPIYLDPAFGPNFTCQYQAIQVADPVGNVTPLEQVTFVVSWTGLTGQVYTRTGTTLVGPNGLIISYQRS